MTRIIRGSVALLVAFALSACGASGGSKSASGSTGYESVFTAIQSLHGKARMDKLLGLAKAEGGNVTVYTSAKSDIAEGIASAFEDFSGLNVGLYRANTEDVAQRIAEEGKAHFKGGGDVAELDGVSFFNLNRDGRLIDYDPDGLSKLGAGANRQGWTVTEFRKFVVGWNTNRVRKGQQPRSWEALTDPRWKGKLALEAGDFEWYGTLRDYWIAHGKSPEEADRIFERMGRNAVAVTGHTLMADLLAAGEFDVAGNVFSSTVDQLRKKGAPVARLPAVQPVVVRSNGVALVRGAPHPAAAVLYLEWLVGPGQKVAYDLGRDPARRDLATKDTFQTVFVDYSKLVEHQKEWTAGYERILSKSKKVEGG